MALFYLMSMAVSGFSQVRAPLHCRSIQHSNKEGEHEKAEVPPLPLRPSPLLQILGYGLAHLPRAGVLHTWRYVFFVEGLITIALGVLAWFLIVDFPDKNRFLTPKETAWVIDRVNVDRGDGDADEITGAKVVKHLLDVKTWMFG